MPFSKTTCLNKVGNIKNKTSRLWFPWAFLMVWELSNELLTNKSVDVFDVANYTFLSPNCGDFSSFFESYNNLLYLVPTGSLGNSIYC